MGGSKVFLLTGHFHISLIHVPCNELAKQQETLNFINSEGNYNGEGNF